ncbi:MAG: methyltransferase domain-containing protein [Desulfuromonadales bacterium]|nr:methyltransferase domain-containing protein [Desulfuromonadales bacterium]
MPWNPEKYNQYKDERARPFQDLCKLLKLRNNLKIVDLGCGTGELTCKLGDLFPESVVTGIDSSEEMLKKAGQCDRLNVKFRIGDIATVEGSWDIIFSNAALHWVDNHETLVPRLFDQLNPDGEIAVQIPNNNASPSHVCIIETAREEPFRSALNGWTRTSPVLPIERYAELLYKSGAEDITVYERVYPHILENADAVADWTSGTTLVPYFEKLPKELHEPFSASYREKLRKRWSGSPVLFPFRRIIFSGHRPKAK